MGVRIVVGGGGRVSSVSVSSSSLSELLVESGAGVEAAAEGFL